MEKQVILASGSPRRQELLRLIVPEYEVIPALGEEVAKEGLSPQETVQQLALHKAKEVAAAHPAALVIGADTIVVVENEILGKPQTPQRSRAMLQKLQGRDHMVYTGVALVGPLGEETFAMGTKVRFAPMDEGEMEAYIATGEPFDKAGAYGIQGFGSAYIEGIEGDYYNVMGLPVQAIYQKLKNR